MNNIYLHYKKNNLNMLYIILCVFLIMFGFYKNGILVYKAFSDNLIILFKPLLFPLITLICSLCFNYLINKKKIIIDENVIYFLLLSMTIPTKTSVILFTIFILILNLINYFVLNKIELNINYVALFKILMILILMMSNNYNYANELEMVQKYSYDLIDIFIGRGISGVSSSSIIILLISYAILSTNIYYKNDIPLISLGTYFLIVIIFKIIFSKVIIVNSLIIFSIVLIAPLNNFSPAIKKQRIFYSIILGMLTFVFTYFINIYDGVTLAIFLSSFINMINFE